MIVSGKAGTYNVGADIIIPSDGTYFAGIDSENYFAKLYKAAE